MTFNETNSQDLVLKTNISCHICQSNETLRLVSPDDFFQVNYLSHPGYGICLSVCNKCHFIYTEFVHPNVISNNFESSKVGHTTELIKEFNTYQNELCQKQNEWLLNKIPLKNDRILYFSAGRSLYAEEFSNHCDQLFVIDLIPSFRIWAESRTELNAIEEKSINEASYIGTFDVIILPNVVNRLSFIKSRFLNFSRILKPGGILIFETPLTTLEEVRAGHFGHEEINFFSERSLNRVISEQSNYRLKNFELNTALENDPSTIQIQSQIKNERISARLILTNEKPNLKYQNLHYNKNDIDSIMQSLSLASLMRAINLGDWLGFDTIRDDIEHHINVEINKNKFN